MWTYLLHSLLTFPLSPFFSCFFNSYSHIPLPAFTSSLFHCWNLHRQPRFLFTHVLGDARCLSPSRVFTVREFMNIAGPTQRCNALWERTYATSQAFTAPRAIYTVLSSWAIRKNSLFFAAYELIRFCFSMHRFQWLESKRSFMPITFQHLFSGAILFFISNISKLFSLSIYIHIFFLFVAFQLFHITVIWGETHKLHLYIFFFTSFTRYLFA